MEKIIYKSPLNFTGSKDKLMPILLEHFPKDVNTFYDVFAGGLAVTINSNYKNIISNDIIEPMVEFYRELQSMDIDQFITKVKSYAIPKDGYDQYYKARSEFNEMYRNDPYRFFALTLSCGNNMMRFNKSHNFNQTFGQRTINDSTVKKLIDYHRVIGEKDIIFTHYDYKMLLHEHMPTRKDFVYLDPPYMIAEAGYNSYWSNVDEYMLYSYLDMLDNAGVRFVMSNVRSHKGVLNPHMDKIEKYTIVDIKHDYEKVSKKKGGITEEIIVKNF